jgi:GDPmannose 4,6-dehydratase
MLTAVITGVAGQDGSYLAELLLDKGYKVVGISRRKSVNNGLQNLEHNVLGNDNFTLLNGDIKDSTFIYRCVEEYRPDEWYNLAAQSNVGHSFKEPVETFGTNALAVVIQLEAIRSLSPSTKFYQASTSELWGGLSCPKTGYSESMRFYPRSPYGVSKLSAYWSVVNHRDAYGLFACSGILHNHSSPRRGFDFATRKITRGVAEIVLGLKDKIKMGDLSAFRDEGHSKDYVEAMHLMLQNDSPKDYVISTGVGATIEDMFRHVASIAGLKFEDIYEADERFMRPSEVPFLLGDSSLAKSELGWSPKYTWKSLLEEMFESDLLVITNERWKKS